MASQPPQSHSIPEHLARKTGRPTPVADLRCDPLEARQNLLQKLFHGHLSRRDLVTVSAALGAGTLWGPLARAASRIEINHDSSGARILVAGVVAFDLSADRFDGSPAISCEKSAENFSLRLSGGYVPGTSAAADLELLGARNEDGWVGSISWPAIGYAARFALEPWLLGEAVALSRMKVDLLLAGSRFGSFVGETSLQATFFPNWVFALGTCDATSLNTAGGQVPGQNVQIQLLRSGSSRLVSLTESRPLTRVMASGVIARPLPVGTDEGKAIFAGASVHALIEMQRDEQERIREGIVLESSSELSAGRITPAVLSDTTTDGLNARWIRVALASDQPVVLEAEFTGHSCWYERDGLSFEVSPSGSTYQSCPNLKNLHAAENLKVTRLIAPMPGADNAVFLRRGCASTASGCVVTSTVSSSGALDGLKWIESHPLRIPLDDFELRMTKGSSAFSAGVAFMDFDLEGGSHGANLQGRSDRSSLEFLLGAQHVAEEAVLQSDLPVASYDLRAAQARFSGPSWLTFGVNADRHDKREIPLSVQDLFDWERKDEKGRLRFVLKLHPLAANSALTLKEQIEKKAIPNAPPARIGGPPSTMAMGSLIQAPYRLGLSPLEPTTDRERVRWRMRGAAAVKDGQLSELWSMRAERLSLRAVWSPDYMDTFWPKRACIEYNKPFRTSLDGADRHEIVALTARFGETALMGSAQVVPDPQHPELPERGIFVPQPVRGDMVLLSSFGATLRLKGRWSPPASLNDAGALSVQLWNQASQLGRDTKVVVEYKGFLMPLGAPATLIKETERRLVFDAKVGFVARLIQRFYIRVTAFTRQLPALEQPFEGRGWPFGNLSMPDYVSPDLEDPSTTEIVAKVGQRAFWPRVANANGEWVDFPFKDTVAAVEASAPLLFVDNYIVHSSDALLPIILHYRNELEQRRGVRTDNGPADYKSLLNDRVGAMGAQRYVARVSSGKIRFAPADKPEKTSFKVLSFLLDVDIPRPAAAKQSDADNSVKPGCDTSFDPIPKRQYPEKVDLAPSDSDTLKLEEDAATPGSTPDFRQALRVSAALEGQNQPPFYPHFRQGLLEPTQLAVLTGGARTTALVEIDSGYLYGGFDSCNAGEIFLRFADRNAKFGVSDDTTHSGGFANTTTIFSAVSRIRGPIGGAGDPLPQPPGYRYKPTCLPAAAAKMLVAAPASSDDPVGKSRSGGFDPKEFFANSLGDAKLCGVVSFVDIVDALLAASGSRAPQILQQLEHELNQGIVHPLATALAPRLAKAADGLKDVPYLQAPVQTLAAQMARAAQAVDSELAATGTALVSSVNDLRDRIHNAIEDPRVLLPKDALDVIDTFLEIGAALKSLQDKSSRDAIINAILANVAQLVREQALSELGTLLVKHPEIAAFAQRTRDIQTALADLQGDLKKDAQSLIVSLPVRLTALLDAIIGGRTWSLWLDTRVAELRTLALGFALTLVKELKASNTPLLSAIPDLKAKIDGAKSYLEVKFNTVPSDQIAPVKQAFLEISDIALAATAQAAELSNSLAALPDTLPSRGLEPQSVAPVFIAVRGIFDCLAKVPRLKYRVAELLKSGLLADDGVLKSYGAWVAAVAGGPLPKIFRQIDSDIGTALQSPSLDASAREGLEEFRTQVAAAISVANNINAAGVALDLLADNLNYAVLSDSLALVAAALNAQQEVRQAVQKAQLAGRQAIVTALANACGRMAAVTMDIQTALDRAQQSTSTPGVAKTIAHWLSPSLRARLDAIVQDIVGLGHAPDPDEASVRMYLAALDALTNDASALVNELGRIAKSGNVAELLDLRAALDEALDKIGAPTSVSITYDWETEVNSYPGGAGAIFIPKESKQLKIHSLSKVDLRSGGTASASVSAWLDKFDINLFGASTFLTIKFKPLIFEAGTGKAAKLTADVETVVFGKELVFVQKIQEWLKEKTGITVDLWDEGPGVVVGYQFNYDIKTCTAFTLQNIGFNISAILPFNSQPARFRFGLSTPEKPFLLSVGIYGGGGFFRIQSRSDTIEYLEASFEYGLVTAFKFGPASGTGRITAGVYIRLGGRNAKIAGFFNASGNADIAGLITVSATFRVVIWYEPNTGCVAGQATFSVTFSIGFLDFSFSVAVAYARQGEGGSKSSNGSNQDVAMTTEPLGWDERALFASNTPMPAIASPQPPATTDVDRMKEQIARKIRPDNFKGEQPDVSRELLRPEFWNKYWSAFEETFDECA